MVWLGDVSFAFYMVHWMVIMFSAPAIGSLPTVGAIGVIVMWFGITLLLSWLLFARVERPIMRRFAVARRSR
jgi:peptidoglycan/LPS O-acetylase OafA/YrhL